MQEKSGSRSPGALMKSLRSQASFIPLLLVEYGPHCPDVRADYISSHDVHIFDRLEEGSKKSTSSLFKETPRSPTEHFLCLIVQTLATGAKEAGKCILWAGQLYYRLNIWVLVI